MTEQKILKKIERNDGYVWFNQEEQEVIKKALEKQIPASPSIEGDGYCPEGNLVYDTWYCPNCDKSYEVDYDDYDYCPNCGQKINREIFY